MAVKYEVVASAGVYKDREGNEKRRWHKCGVVMETKNGGLALKLESMPIPFDGWLNLWEPKPRDDERPAKPDKAGAFDDFKDDIPFR